MNREAAKGIVKHFECVKAFAEGKTLEYRAISGNEWVRVDTPSFCANGQYRIRPEPRSLYRIEFKTGAVFSTCKTKCQADLDLADAKRRYGPGAEFRIVEFLEVMK